MPKAKLITNTIYFVGLIAAIILDIDNFQFYFGIVFVAFQIVFIAAEYVITKWIIPHEAVLIKKNSPFTLNDLLLVILLIIALFIGFNILFKSFTAIYLLTCISIAVLSGIVQFLITKNKNTATFLIDNSKLIINDLHRDYDLHTLNKINYNSYDEIYIAEFANSKKIKIIQNDYKKDDSNKFITMMTTKSNSDVVLSENIKTT